MTIFTKWWYILVEDGPDEMLYGFPFPYVAPAWHTSLAKQYFLLPLIADLLFYFCCWLIVIFTISRLFVKIKISKVLSVILISITTIILGMNVYLFFMTDSVATWRRTFKMDIMDTGYDFIWQKREWPDFYKYHPERKPK